MKTVILFLLAVLSFTFTPLSSNAQFDNFVFNAPDLFCGGAEPEFTMPAGSFFPMENDTLRVLVVFANYPDGNYQVPGNPSVLLDHWPASSYLQKPSWADSIICPTTTNVWHPSLTGLFQASSGGKFWLIGDVYPDLVVLDNAISYYTPGQNRNLGYATKEIISKIDSNVNWSNYDKFAPNNPTNKRQPDGVVDFIFIIFRFHAANVTDPPRYTGYAALGGRSRRFNGNQTHHVTHDGKHVLAYFPGSGSIQEIQNRWDIGIPAHEYGQHYTFSDNHNEVMGAYNINGGGIASADDREVIGWVFGNVYEPTSNATITLRDYVTKGDYIKIPRTNDVIYIESRGRYNYYSSEDYKLWKWGANDPRYPAQPDSGLVIYRKLSTHIFDIQSADGKWNWLKCIGGQHKITFFTGSHNIWYHDTPDRFSGISSFYLQGTVRDLNCDPIPNPFHPTFDPITGDIRYRGIGGDSNSCFDVGYNQIYSPWSNPALPVTNTNDSLLVEITGYGGRAGEMVVKVYFDNLLDAPPSKPTGVREVYHADPMLPDVVYTAVKWVHNIEPDMLRSGDLKRYEVYRGISSNMNEPTSYSLLATVNIHKDSLPIYIDTILAQGSYVGGTPPPIYYAVGYKIKAIDNTDQTSIYSDRAKVTAVAPNSCTECEEDNLSNGNVEDKILSIKNFPNPFNPSTMLQYSLPNDGFVTLKIYDITGKEIAVLVNEFKQKGSYKVAFNAQKNGLSSGIYFYTFTANGKTLINRLVLIK